MGNTYHIEYTDTFAGEANYCWVKRAKVTMPELTYYGYDGGTNYAKANKVYQRELMRQAKAAIGLSGVRGVTYRYGDMVEFRPHGSATVMFINWSD
jgi:hypothetical protein